MANPSLYDQRITIQRKTESIAADGSPVAVWADVATVWARVTYDAGRESDALSQTTAFNSVTFEIRHSPQVSSLSSADRISWNDTYFNFGAVLPVPAGRPNVFKITATAN
jgi:SPP1 family predicted phage head-tail adaptor